MARVEAQVARCMKQMAEAMGRSARDSDRLDRAVVAALDSEPGDWPAALQEQNRHVALAERASDSGLRIITSTALGALASALVATAAGPEEGDVVERPGRLRCRPLRSPSLSAVSGFDQPDRAYCFGPELVLRVRMPLLTDHVAVVAAPPLGRRVTLLFCTWNVPPTVPCASC